MAHLSNSVDITDHVVLFIPSYLDFLRIRAWCKEQSVNFQSLHEYSKPGAIVRARRAFLRGECHFLLVTERYYFYHRLAVRNVHKIVFYALPETPQFYPEWLDAARPPPGAFKSAMGHNATILFTRYDRLRLERIVGTERAHQMLTAASDSVIFST
ncbi:DUF1253-domain-containing protein [Caulochytrium protostelioides]|uniref:U3 small nucleolar RNA-associated protein 25 n=1 Tax=Caulochytrium protostelioides TaxID=1555241 RepID=A0A4P9WSI3_9FUNG|nr:DUF1253-domain-containing protein [Caulochytrium protostelioides]